jgi:hypothetical protein
MRYVKASLTFLFACVVGIGICYLLMTAIVQEQEQREASAIQKIQAAKVGSHIRVAGCGLLKTSGVKK